MSISAARLARIAVRLEATVQIANMQFPSSGLEDASIEVRQATREKLNLIKTVLQASLVGIEDTPVVAEISQSQLQESIEHGMGAILLVHQARLLLSLLMNPPTGLTLTTDQRTSLEKRLITLRDAALAGLGLM